MLVHGAKINKILVFCAKNKNFIPLMLFLFLGTVGSSRYFYEINSLKYERKSSNTNYKGYEDSYCSNKPTRN